MHGAHACLCKAQGALRVLLPFVLGFRYKFFQVATSTYVPGDHLSFEHAMAASRGSEVLLRLLNSSDLIGGSGLDVVMSSKTGGQAANAHPLSQTC